MEENSSFQALTHQLHTLYDSSADDFNLIEVFRILGLMEEISVADEVLEILNEYKKVQKKFVSLFNTKIYQLVRSKVEALWHEANIYSQNNYANSYISEYYENALLVARRALAQYSDNTQLESLAVRAESMRVTFAKQESLMTSGMLLGEFEKILRYIDQLPDEMLITVYDEFGSVSRNMPKNAARYHIVMQARSFVERELTRLLDESMILVRRGLFEAALHELERYKRFTPLQERIPNLISSEKLVRINHLEMEILKEAPELKQQPQVHIQNNPEKIHKTVFISYSHNDVERMKRIVDFLAESFIKIWVDTGIEIGTKSWRKWLENALESSEYVIVLLSPSAKQSEWVAVELDHARIHEKKIYAILLEGDEKSAIPFGYGSMQWLDLRDPSKSETHLAQLLKTIHGQQVEG